MNTTTTTTATAEAAKNLAIYNAIADHARHAFELLDVLPGQYTPAQVADLLKKSRARWTDNDRRREVVAVSVGSFSCSFELSHAFALLAQVATAYDIPTRDRAPVLADVLTAADTLTTATTTAQDTATAAPLTAENNRPRPAARRHHRTATTTPQTAKFAAAPDTLTAAPLLTIQNDTTATAADPLPLLLTAAQADTLTADTLTTATADPDTDEDTTGTTATAEDDTDPDTADTLPTTATAAATGSTTPTTATAGTPATLATPAPQDTPAAPVLPVIIATL